MIKPFPFTRAQMQNCIDRPSKGKNPLGLTKEELVAHAAARGLPISGNKPDLCERIINYEEGAVKPLPKPAVVIARPIVVPKGRLVVVRPDKPMIYIPPSPPKYVLPAPVVVPAPVLTPGKELSKRDMKDMDMQLAEGVSLKKPFFRDLITIKGITAPQMEQGVELGKGSFGSVAVLVRQPSVVVKRYNTYTRDVLKEVTFLKNLNGLPSIVKVFGFVPGSLDKYGKEAMFRLYLQKYDSILPHKVSYTEDQFKRTMFKIIEGVYHIHMRGIIHADLKPHNTLVKDDEVAVADLGIARVDLPMWTRDWKVTSALQTAWYRAPEVVASRDDPPHSQAIDIWSIGCIMYDLIMKNTLLPHMDAQTLYANIVRLFGKFPYTTPTINALLGPFISLEGPQVPPLTSNPDRWKYIFAGKADGPPDEALIPHWALNPELLELLTGIFQIDPSHRVDIVTIINSDYFADIKGDRVFPNLNWVQRFKSIQKEMPEIPAELIEDAQFITSVRQIMKDVSATHRARALALDLFCRCAINPGRRGLKEIAKGCLLIAKNFHDATSEVLTDNILQLEIFNAVDNNVLTSTYYDFICAIGYMAKLTQLQVQKSVDLIYYVMENHTTSPIIYSCDYLTQAVTAIAAATGTLYGPEKYHNKALHTLMLA